MNKTSRSVLARILDSSSKGIVAIDTDYRVTAFNNRFSELAGDHAPESGKDITLYFGDEGERIRTLFERALNGETFVIHDSPELAGDTVRSFEHNYFPIRGKSGRIKGAALMMTDVTELMILRRQTRLYESRYRAFVNMMPDLLVLTDTTGQICFCNEAYARYFGKEQSAVKGESFFEFIPRSRRSPLTRRIKALSPEHPVFSGAFLVTSVEGQKRWTHWNFTGVFDEKGGLIEVLAVGRNIDRLKRAELYRDRQFHSLETRISSTSDQVKQPLAGLLGATTLINQSNPESIGEIVTSLNKSSDLLDQATRELVDFIQGVKARK